MKLSTASALLLLVQSSTSFSPQPNQPKRVSTSPKAADATLLSPSEDTAVPSSSSKHFSSKATSGKVKLIKNGEKDASSSSLSTLSTATSTTGNNKATKGPLSMQIEELGELLGGKGRAQIAWDCYSIGIDPQNIFGDTISLGYDDFETIYNMRPSCRRTQRLGKDALEKLANMYESSRGRVENGVASLAHITRSRDDTTKLLLKLADGLQVETVIIPWNGKRSTLCISSQVGCRQGCKFCATGRMGKLRDLTSDEIIAQMFFATKIARLEGLPEIRNVVFMGMGEPADNAENVVAATEILTKRELFSLSMHKVTVSTVGPSPEAFTTFAKAPCVLAWSVHAANDDLRKQLVPTTKYSMVELRQGFIDALLQRPKNFRTTMLEVALMAGVNDTLEAADELAAFAKVIVDSVPECELMINLIPFNDIGHGLYRKPEASSVLAFQKRLQDQGLMAPVRVTRGDDTTAACGQLATQKSQKRP